MGRPPAASPADRKRLACLLLIAAAAAALAAPLVTAAPAATAAVAPPPRICAAPLQAARTQQQRLPAIARRQPVILLGEIHTSVADHAWQLQSLQTLTQAGLPLQLGLEMVPAARQAALDRYGRGESDEATFLKEVGWAEVWGHDPALYLPLLRWARQQGVPLLALNAEPALVRRVRREGLAAVPPAERQGIGEPAPLGAAYRERLRAAWRAHGRGPGGGSGGSSGGSGEDGADLERFLDSQRLRDRAMAERLAAARQADPQRLVVALIGRGHLEGDDGVPAQLRDLGLGSSAVLLRPELPPPCAPAPPGARLGAYLESADGAVWVRRLAPLSAAARAGLQPGDRIVAVNGEPVQRAGQVILRVAQQPAAQPLRLTVERGGRRRELTLRLPPPPAPGRPTGENGASPGVRAPSP
jgi:uncharacterized iron-regulated protein